jgi:hypothetical protein
MEDNEPVKENVLEEAISMEGYDRPVRTARTILFVIAGMQLLSLLVLPDNLLPGAKAITVGTVIFVAVVFIALAIWTNWKPYTAIITGLIFYSSLVILDTIIEPSSLLNGLIFKILVYVMLVPLLGNSRDVQRWKNMKKKNAA